MFSVAIYLVCQGYGGPEEGGWWYECGIPSEMYCEMTRIFRTEEEAIEYSQKLKSLCSQLNEGLPPISHSNSVGEFVAIVADGYPAPYPTQRPFYE
jgi:hypothetical protein